MKERRHIIQRLKVLCIFQPDGVTCVPTCLKMVLEYINDGLGGGNLNLSIGDISKIVGTTEDGTVFDDVNKINKNMKILKAIPSIEFVVKYEYHILKDIEDEIKNGRPAIAWILPLGARNMKHSIVITGLDLDKSLIYYNDPISGEVEARLGEFMSLWDKTDRTLIRVKIGKREQRLLDEWLKEKMEGAQ